MSHRYPECPISCNLYDDMLESYPFLYNPLVVNWVGNIPEPYLEIFSEDKFLHNQLFGFNIQCQIDDRAPQPVATNTFTVTVYDECFDTTISPPASAQS